MTEFVYSPIGLRFCSICLLLRQCHIVFITIVVSILLLKIVRLLYILRSGTVIPPALSFILGIVLTLQDL